jgi:N-acetylneuraminic acid mutarotase
VKTSLLIFSILLSTGSFCQAWQQMNNFPDARRDDAVGFSIGDMGYMGTGRDEGFAYRNDFWQYNPVTDSWSAIAPLPGAPRQYAASFVIGSKAYVFGGLLNDQGECLRELWEYDPALNSWTRRADLPGEARQSCVAFASGGRGYICTGRNNKTTYLKDCWQYDPETDSWKRLPDLPGPARYEANVMQFEDAAYIGAGRDGNVFLTDLWKLNCNSGQWQFCRPFPYKGLYYSQGFFLNGRGYYSTGEDENKQFISNTYVYNFLTDSWSQGPSMPATERRGTAAFTIGNDQYFITGLTKDMQRTGEVWKFSTEPLREHRVYPNPAREKLVIEVTGKNNLFVLYDSFGKVAKQFMFETEQYQADFSDLRKGTYFYTINNKLSGRVVVE